MAEKRYAILIGNQAYENSDFNPLNSPHADVDALEAVLKDETKGRFDSVEVLKEANREDALDAIEDALKAKSKNDLLLIYFSGHGKTNDDGDLYLAASNTDGNRLETRGISAEQISRWLGRGSVDKTVLILDCCHAGAFAQGFKSGDELQTKTDGYARAGGSYVLMACDAYELARDGANGALSFMTEHIVEGLSGAADANGDGNITVDELTDYLDRQMSVGAKQTFNQACYDKRGEIILSWAESSSAEIDPLERAKQKVLDWARDGSLSDEVYPQVLALIPEIRRGVVESADQRRSLIEMVSDDGIKPGNFNIEWIKAQSKPDQSTSRKNPKKPVAKSKLNATTRNVSDNKPVRPALHRKAYPTEFSAASKQNGGFAEQPIPEFRSSVSSKSQSASERSSAKRVYLDDLGQNNQPSEAPKRQSVPKPKVPRTRRKQEGFTPKTSWSLSESGRGNDYSSIIGQALAVLLLVGVIGGTVLYQRTFNQVGSLVEEPAKIIEE